LWGCQCPDYDSSDPKFGGAPLLRGHLFGDSSAGRAYEFGYCSIIFILFEHRVPGWSTPGDNPLKLIGIIVMRVPGCIWSTPGDNPLKLIGIIVMGAVSVLTSKTAWLFTRNWEVGLQLSATGRSSCRFLLLTLLPMQLAAGKAIRTAGRQALASDGKTIQSSEIL
jgi:hypothetical protein